MFNLVNSSFNRTYNPSGKQNALSDIKRLLLSRDTAAQNKACVYLTEVVSRYNKNSKERFQMIDYLLDNDIAVFLCESTTNLEFQLFRSILDCMRLLWSSNRFFIEEHAAQAMAAVVRALMHYSESGNNVAVSSCLNFLDDLLNGITTNKTEPALSDQSAYSTVQLLACLNALIPHIITNPKSVISSALVLHALVSYQPDNLIIKVNTANALVDVLKKYFTMLIGALNHSVLINNEFSGMFYTVLCYLSLDVLRLVKLLSKGQQNNNFVQSILADDEEINMLMQVANDMGNSVQLILSELVTFTKDHEGQISSEEYGVFLKCLLIYFSDNTNTKALSELGDLLFSKGYLRMLPQVQITRQDVTIRMASTLVLGEMLKVLSDKYLNVNDLETDSGTCAKDIHMGLVELQYGIEKPQDIGTQLQKGQPYSLLIYIYFYCQSTDNPEEATGPLLPYLVEHVLRLPRSFKPPPYIIKALWLVFAMSAISNNSLESLDERVFLEKATDRIIAMLHPEPSIYYTHNPAILLWSFTSQRIPNYIKLIVLSEWLKTGDSLPVDLTNEPIVWELLLNILVQNIDVTIVGNCMDALRTCSRENDEDKQRFTVLVWNMIPDILSKALIGNCQLDTNICHVLELAMTLAPIELEPTTCLKIAVLMTTLFSKNNLEYSGDPETRHHYEYVCMKLSLDLLGLASNQNDNRILLLYTNRIGFLSSVITATNSLDDTVACAALNLLSHIVYYFTRNNYQPKSILEIDTNLIIESLRRDSLSERGTSLLQLVYMLLNSGANAPMTLTSQLDSAQCCESNQYSALRALMLTVQMMLCCRENNNQTSAGWKTLSAIFKYSIIHKNDTRLVATLTSQPWTHILVQFQLGQNITQEFLTFVQNWLTLLRITINKNRKERRTQMCEQSLVIKTMITLRRNLIAEDEFKGLTQSILSTVTTVLNETRLKID